MSVRIGRAALVAALLATGSAAGSGCATSGDVDRLEARIGGLEKFRDRLEQSMKEDVARLEKLHQMLTEAEETLRKSGANLGLRVERLETDDTKLKGDLEAATVQLRSVEADLNVIKRELADRLGSTAFFLPHDLPKDKDGMWAAGEKAAAAGDVRQTQAIFELYEASFPDDVRAPTALWEIAKAMESHGDTDEAIRYYQKVFDRHHDAPIAPQAVMRIAEIYVIKGDCGRAKSILKFAGDEFKSGPEGAAAKKRLKELGKDCK
ncbi:MAG: tetratricopeptide repeat protein [Deltaproteobacteria bacterium]|nr:tetratricopeptide repeat protein [Deltaproteobacteria bacterium]